jgi:MarR family transcriptional regulator, 2-MHQ and catechol-resistance regulon repressor
MTTRRLQHELRKKRPFDSAEQEASLQILRTADRLQNRLGRFFRGAGRPLPSLEVAEQMIQVVPAITGLIDRLEKQGLVERRRCEEDRRVVYVEIMPRAATLLKTMDQPLADLHKQLLGHMGRKALIDLSRLLETAREQLHG